MAIPFASMLNRVNHAGMELTGLPMWTIVDGIPVHKRTPGGSFRGEAVGAPGCAGRALRFA